MRRTPHDQLELLRQTRRARTPEWSIHRQLGAEARRLRDAQRKKTGAAAAWSRVVPPELRAVCDVIGQTRGALRVRVSDPSARFAVDRWLRAGGLEAIIRAAPKGLQRVKLEI